jgi:hypothetical protein
MTHRFRISGFRSNGQVTLAMKISTLKFGKEVDAGNVFLGILQRNGGKMKLKLRANATMLPDELRKGVRWFESGWNFNYRFSIVWRGLQYT